MTAEILLSNLRYIQKLLSPKYLSKSSTLTDLLIVMAAANYQAIQLFGDVPHPLLKVLNQASSMCDPIKIKRCIAKTIGRFIEIA